MSWIDSVRRAEQAPEGSLLDEVAEDFVNSVFEVSEEAIGRVSWRRSIEVTIAPDEWILQSTYDWTSTADVLVITMQKASEEFWWSMYSCSPPLVGDEYVVLTQKFELEMFR